jgi:hypothetical protein
VCRHSLRGALISNVDILEAFSCLESRCFNELVSVLALPAMWSGHERDAHGNRPAAVRQVSTLCTAAHSSKPRDHSRYRGGATSYLEVLDSDTRLFSAELGVAQAQLNELLALVQIYRALGGGGEQ